MLKLKSTEDIKGPYVIMLSPDNKPVVLGNVTAYQSTITNMIEAIKGTAMCSYYCLIPGQETYFNPRYFVSHTCLSKEEAQFWLDEIERTCKVHETKII